jgi:hypothetical protein
VARASRRQRRSGSSNVSPASNEGESLPREEAGLGLAIVRSITDFFTGGVGASASRGSREAPFSVFPSHPTTVEEAKRINETH